MIVVKNNKRLGELSQDSNQICFSYDIEIDHNEYLPGLNKPINRAIKLFPVFENLLPEHEQLTILKEKHSIINEIDVLLHLYDIHGSLEFYSEDEFSSIELKPYVQFDYSDVADTVLQNNYIYPNILDYRLDIPDDILYPKELKEGRAMGLSGFQYKFSVIIDHSAKVISNCADSTAHYLMKPFSPSFHKFDKLSDSTQGYIPYLLINEHIFMTMARDFGFNVPYNAIIKDGIDYHYVIKRYDRFEDSKIDHAEFLTLLNKHSDQKYKITIKEIFHKAQEYLDFDGLLELFEFIVFSIIIGHGDLHAKNISLINKSNASDETKKQLAPYYDISTTDIYKGLDSNDIGMKIKNKQSKITYSDLIWIAGTVGIEESVAKTSIDKLCTMFIDGFEEYIVKLPNEVKTLLVKVNRSHKNALDDVFYKYYRKRVKYINKMLLVKSVMTDKPKSPWQQ
jgi:serine/threonine-protein kinase HipA